MTTTFILDRLRPALDCCRDLTEHRLTAKSWSKSLTHGDAELVTEIDLAVESVLTEAIHDHLPDAAILSEESNPDPSALASDTLRHRSHRRHERASGRPSGLRHFDRAFQDGRPTAALLDLPAYDRRFHCAAGGGSYLNGKRREAVAD